MDFNGKAPRKNPFANANVISRAFFLWIIPLFRKGKRKNLSLDDLYDPLDADVAGKLGDRMEAEWARRMKACAEGKRKKPSLVAALFTLLGRYYMLSSIGFVIGELVFRMAQPIVLRELIRSFSPEYRSKISKRDQYLLAIGLTVSTLGTLLYHPSAFYLYRISMRCRLALSSLIYRKALRLSTSAAYQKTNVGAIVNLLSNDVNRFDQNLIWIIFIPIGFVQLVVYSYLIYNEFGLAGMTGIVALVALIPFQYFNGKLSAKYRLKIAERTDERGRVMSEIITGIRILKMYNWEKAFSLIIHGLRKLEVSALRKRLHIKGIYFCLYSAAPKLFSFLTLITYIQDGGDLLADQVFFTTTLYFTLALIWIANIPMAMSGMGDIYTCLDRICDFLQLEEKVQSPNFRAVDKCDGGSPQISIQSVSAQWTPEYPTLSQISTVLSGDKVVCIVGPCGSGKSSLLHVLLGELPIGQGKLLVEGGLSYAAQEPWVFAASVRKNILFGRPFVRQKYDQCVKAACLLDDFKQLPYGDLTVVGDRGISLSGGQKARLSLARCLYQDADIYLLDDPLSAVDTKVSRHLFENCVRRHLRNKLKILVTHQLQYLPQADHVIVLKEGQIFAQGSYQELVDAKVDFVGLMVKEDEHEVATQEDGKESQRRTSSCKRVSLASNASGEVAAGDEEEHGTEYKGGNSTEETKASGAMGAKIYWDYFKMGRSAFLLFFTVFIFLLCQLSLSAVDYFLSFWTNAEMKMDEETYLGRNNYIYIYAGLTSVAIVTSIFRSVLFMIYTTRIGIHVHNAMFSSLVRARIRFFDQNPSGRIMNRFTKDLGSMDELLPQTMLDMLTLFAQLFGAVVVIVVSNYYMAPPALIVFGLLWWVRSFYVRTTREVKRIEGIAKSPIFTHSAATFTGLTTIRALKAESVLINQFDALQDVHTSAWFLFFSSARAFGVYCELLTALFLTVISISFLLMQDSMQMGNVGLAISAAMTLSGELQYGLRQSAEVENQMTSVERNLEYTKLPSEASLETEPDKMPEDGWPKHGTIQFHNVSMSYHDNDVTDLEKQKLPSDTLVLKNLSFEIGAREKIGVVGRTGAGKSSIIQAIFRLTEIRPEGRVSIDGVNIRQIGLHTLRKVISIIPQDPILFSGTMRYNLDPFNKFKDDELWAVIGEVELKNAVPALDFHVADGGANFSVGQRQLVCLARAILRRNRIIIMDEATANVDPETDLLIQKAIRGRFANCTIITVAHRLHTVIDCDKILVLEKGCLREFDSPWNLLQREQGVFRGMLEQLGLKSVELLRNAAEQTHKARISTTEEVTSELPGISTKSSNK